MDEFLGDTIVYGIVLKASVSGYQKVADTYHSCSHHPGLTFSSCIMLISSAGKFALRRHFSCLVCSLSTVQTAQLSSARPNPRQRRFSSSKPASPPNDDPRSLPAAGDAPTKSSAPSPTRKRSVARAGRQKTKDASPAKAVEDLTSNLSSSLPSVPSTQHLHRHGNLFCQKISRNHCD